MTDNTPDDILAKVMEQHGYVSAFTPSQRAAIHKAIDAYIATLAEARSPEMFRYRREWIEKNGFAEFKRLADSYKITLSRTAGEPVLTPEQFATIMADLPQGSDGLRRFAALRAALLFDPSGEMVS